MKNLFITQFAMHIPSCKTPTLYNRIILLFCNIDAEFNVRITYLLSRLPLYK